MIEFAIVLLIKRITGANDNQIPSTKREECRRENSRTGKLLSFDINGIKRCFYQRNSSGTIFDTNAVETNSVDTYSIATNSVYSNSIPELGEEQTSVSQKRYSITDKIDFVAFFVFMFSYIIFNSVYVAHYM